MIVLASCSGEDLARIGRVAVRGIDDVFITDQREEQQPISIRRPLRCDTRILKQPRTAANARHDRGTVDLLAVGGINGDGSEGDL